jgi:hypothetical protein
MPDCIAPGLCFPASVFGPVLLISCMFDEGDQRPSFPFATKPAAFAVNVAKVSELLPKG